MPTDPPPSETPALRAAGGWCAPAPYDTGPHWGDVFMPLPKFAVPRGGITFPRPPEPGTPEWEAQKRDWEAQEAIGALIRRHIESAAAAQDYALATALADAARLVLTVHTYAGPSYVPGWRYEWGPYRFISISLEERERPTEPVAIHHHPHSDPDYWDED